MSDVFFNNYPAERQRRLPPPPPPPSPTPTATPQTSDRFGADPGTEYAARARLAPPPMPGAVATPTATPAPTPTPTPAAAGKPAEKPGVLGQVGGFFVGGWDGAVDTVKGVGNLAVGTWSLTGGWLTNPDASKETVKNLGNTVDAVVKHPGAVLEGIVKPVTEPWQNGEYGKAVGRGLFEVAGAIVGTKGLDKVAKVGKVGEVASVATKATEALTAASRIEKTAEAATTATKVAEATAAAEKAATALAAAEKAVTASAAAEKAAAAQKAAAATVDAGTGSTPAGALTPRRGLKPAAAAAEAPAVDAAVTARRAENAKLMASDQLANDAKAVGVTPERLQLMLDKKAPLSFKSAEQFTEFKAELHQTLEKAGLKDATTEMRGTSTTFYSENPKKALGHHFDAKPTELADVDISLHSPSAAVKMEAAGMKPHPDIPSIFKTRNTYQAFPELKNFADKWQQILGREVNFVGLTSKAPAIVDPLAFGL